VADDVNTTGRPKLLLTKALGFSQATKIIATPTIKKIELIIDRISSVLGVIY
jgi:hypothetical protein